jgi:hypothetical protein
METTPGLILNFMLFLENIRPGQNLHGVWKHYDGRERRRGGHGGGGR